MGLVFERSATLRLIAEHAEVASLAISPDGTLLAGSGAIGAVQLWHLPDDASAGLLEGPEV